MQIFQNEELFSNPMLITCFFLMLVMMYTCRFDLDE